jgi:hypothetical protein
LTSIRPATQTTDQAITTQAERKYPQNCDFDTDMCGWTSENNKWLNINGENSEVFGLYGPGSDFTSTISNK